MISLCNRVCELSIIKISVESSVESRNKKNKKVHIDLTDSNDFTYKEYEA